MKKILFLMLTLVLAASLGSAALADTYGLGVVTSISSSKAATAEAEGKAQADTTVCALVLDDEGKIVSVKFDVAQTVIAFSAAGEITADMNAEIKTKKELGDDYGMRKASGIGKEAFEQIEALEAWCIGKTIDEAVTKANAGDDADLRAGATFTVTAYMAALVKAAEDAES